MVNVHSSSASTSDAALSEEFTLLDLNDVVSVSLDAKSDGTVLPALNEIAAATLERKSATDKYPLSTRAEKPSKNDVVTTFAKDIVVFIVMLLPSVMAFILDILTLSS